MLLIVFTVMTLFSGSVSMEAHCSKFHYEEKLLEKVIRMGIRMEQIEAKLKAYEDLEKSLEQKLNQKLESSGIKIPIQSKPEVSFTAEATQSQIELKADQILIFDHVLTNIGNSYHPNSGQFVAPVGGKYFFYCSVLSGNGAEIWVSIVVNNTVKVKFYARGTDGRHDMGSQALVVTLHAGDVVSVQNLYQVRNVYVMSLLSASVSMEAHCSKFHYEEKLLEKVIRMGIRMEQIEAKVRVYEDWEESLEQKLDQKLEQFRSGIEVPVQKKSAVSFTAEATKGQNDVGKGQILIFDHVLTNIGNGYSPSSGRFVAPVGGTYFFYCSVLSGNGAEIWVSIAVNNSSKAMFYARGTDGRHDMGSQALVLRLNAGDEVSVHSLADAGNIYGGKYTAFSGFLIN